MRTNNRHTIQLVVHYVSSTRRNNRLTKALNQERQLIFQQKGQRQGAEHSRVDRHRIQLVDTNATTGRLFFLNFRPPFRNATRRVFQVQSARNLRQFVQITSRRRLSTNVPRLLRRTRTNRHNILGVVRGRRPKRTRHLRAREPTKVVHIVNNRYLVRRADTYRRRVQNVRAMLPQVYHTLNYGVFATRHRDRAPLRQRSHILHRNIRGA